MKINNEISNNFELLVGSKHEQASFSLLSGLFSINFGEVFSKNNRLVPVTEYTTPPSDVTVEKRNVRFRTVGDISCTCPVLSSAKNPEEIILETASSSLSERGATRLDDQTNEASMERRKKEGYF